MDYVPEIERAIQHGLVHHVRATASFFFFAYGFCENKCRNYEKTNPLKQDLAVRKMSAKLIRRVARSLLDTYLLKSEDAVDYGVEAKWDAASPKVVETFFYFFLLKAFVAF